MSSSFEMTNEFEKKHRLTDEEDDDVSPTGTLECLGSGGGGPGDQGVIDSIEPLTAKCKQREVEKDRFKDRLSFALSVFNLMNAILGSGILGLADALKNLGIIPFILLLLCTATLASYTINMLLHVSQIMGMKSYESLSHRSFGYIGKIVTTVIIILHCLGAMCSYVYIVKKELPEFVTALLGEDGIHHGQWYTNGDFLMLIVVAIVIIPLAAMKDIKFLGYSSAFGMCCMLLFTFTVVGKKVAGSIPCPLELSTPHLNESATEQPESLSLDEEEQYCDAKLFVFNSRSAYAVPTMFFSFMCHASMLPIYNELRRPSIKRMQRVANVSICLVLVLYLLSAMFGYFTFFNKVQSELLLTYSQVNSHDPIILVSRFMVIICVTLSVPLLHYPARRTIILTFCKNPQEFKWLRHLFIMICFIVLTVLLVLYIPDIRNIFGFAGATTSTTLLVILPSLFMIKLTGSAASERIQKEYFKRRMFAWFLCVFGIVFMCLSTAMIVMDWLEAPAKVAVPTLEPPHQ